MTKQKYFRALLSFLLLAALAIPAAAKETKQDVEPENPAAGVNSGTVIAVHTAGRYTYIHLAQDPDKEEVWLAAGLSVAVGDRIEYRGGVPMQAFHSETLNRTFDKILFVSAIRKVTNETQQADKNMVNVPNDDFHRELSPGQAKVTLPTADEIKRSATEKSIGEIFADLDALNGMTIGLRAKVIKVGSGIMGKNWITLVDGTGKAPDDKLLATTKQMVQIGSTLSVNGILRTNVDLGSGYKYKAVLEEAVFMP